MLRAGAHVQVMAPELCPNLAKLRDEGRIEHLAAGYRDGDLDDAYLAIAATDSAEINHEVAAAGRALGSRSMSSITRRTAASSCLRSSIARR